MWISWDDHENVSIVELGKHNPTDKGTKTCGKFDKNYTRELVDENRRLWVELKQKNEMMISLRDDVYYKERALQSLERYKEEMQRAKNDQQYLDLVREIDELKNDQREKQTLVNFLNEMIENLCDEVLQNEHVECLESEMALVEGENQKLSKENAEIKVKLKIVEYDNEKLHARFDQTEEENHTLKMKLEKTTKKLKERERSMLSFKKFGELANNLQHRITRSKSENQTLKNVIERMRRVADDYERLDGENRELKRALLEAEAKRATLEAQVSSLQEAQLKLNQSETIAKPALAHENQELKRRLRADDAKIRALVEDNVKLKTNLKIYEKMLIENKAYVEEQQARTEIMKAAAEENEKLKASLEALDETIGRELAAKKSVVDENQFLRNEHDRLAAALEETQTSKRALLSDVMSTKRHHEEAEGQIDDLKKQLQIYRNTVHNQDATLKIRLNEMDSIVKQNKELKLKIKQYESQIQMEGKIYKIVR